MQIRAARGWQEDVLLSCSCKGSVLDSQCALSALPAGTISCLAFQASSTEDAEREPSFDEAQPQHGDWVRVADIRMCLRHATPRSTPIYWGEVVSGRAQLDDCDPNTVLAAVVGALLLSVPVACLFICSAPRSFLAHLPVLCLASSQARQIRALLR